MWLKIILKVTKKQGFTLSLEYVFFEKPQESEGRGGDGQNLPNRERFKTKGNLTVLNFTWWWVQKKGNISAKN